MNDVELSVGADASPAAAGLAELRNYGQKAQSELTSIFAQTIAFTGLIAGFEQVIQKAHDIHHEAERFGVDAQQLQLIANAAKEDGVSMETVARAINKVALAGPEAAKYIGALGISLDAWLKMNPEERFYAVADAVHTLGNTTETYNAVAHLLGTRFGTELIPTLEKGSDAIRQIGGDMGTMSDETIASLDRIHQTTEKIKNELTVNLGGALATFIGAWRTGWYDIFTIFDVSRESIVSGMKVINSALHFDFEGAKKEMNNFLSFAREMFKSTGDFEKEALGGGPPAAGSRPRPAPSPSGAPSDSSSSSPSYSSPGTGSSGSGASSIESLSDRLNKLNEEALHREEPLQQKLIDLQKEKNDLLTNYTNEASKGQATEEDYYQVGIAMAEKQKEIDATQKSITAEEAKSAAAAEKARQAAEDEADAAERQNQQLRDTVAFGSTIAAKLAEQRQLQGEIDDVTARINEAWSEGDQALAEQLTTLRDELNTSKDLTDEINKQAEAAARLKQTQADIATGLQRASQGFGAYPGTDTILKSLQANVSIGGDPFVTEATDERTGKVDQDKLQKLRLEYERQMKEWELHGYQGPMPSLPSNNAKIQRIADQQARAAAQSSRDAAQQRIDQINALLDQFRRTGSFGTGSGAGNGTGPAPTVPVVPGTGAGGVGGIGDLGTANDLLSKALAVLVAIEKKITPPLG